MEQATPELLTTASITNAFQPVHLVTPPGSPTLVTEKNTAYVEALRQLRASHAGHGAADQCQSGQSGGESTTAERLWTRRRSSRMDSVLDNRRA